MKVIVVSGGFDPLHSGHIAYFAAAKKLGDRLVVALNSDEWLVNKKGKNFMPFDERASIISNLKMVDEVISFDDDKYGGSIKYSFKYIILCLLISGVFTALPAHLLKKEVFIKKVRENVVGAIETEEQETFVENWI